MIERLSRTEKKVLKLHDIRTKISMLQFLYASGIVDDDSKLVHNKKFMKYSDVMDNLVNERDSLEGKLKELGVIK